MKAEIKKVMVGQYAMTLTAPGCASCTMNYPTRKAAKRAAKRMGYEVA